MERKSKRMVHLTYLLVISLMALYGTHTLAGDHRYKGPAPADGHLMDYWWVEANNSLRLKGEAQENGSAIPGVSSAPMPYWWENKAGKQSHAWRYGWQNTVNGPMALMSYWWHHPPGEAVSLPQK